PYLTLHLPHSRTLITPASPLSPYTTLFRPPRPQPPVHPVALGDLGEPPPQLFAIPVQIEQDPHEESAGLDIVELLRGRFAEVARSEEHTSELQSHLNIVCRLLLEKKNNTKD